MPTIEITDDQRDYLEDLRADLADEHVGAYGTVRARDALQFLIDRYESEGDEEAAGTEGTDGEDTGDSTDDGADGNDGADRLEAMMNLLDTHDDKWEESDSEEGRYVVTLPDGETEHARTQDDVRALLFKHYG